jgi:hypothetical protein
MQPSDLTHFTTTPKEQIKVHICVDKRPFLCSFETPPEGATWDGISTTEVCDTRSFVMPQAQRDTVIFDATFDAQIADDDPTPQATYTVTISGSAGGNSVSKVVVPKGVFPITETFVFMVNS